MARLARRRSIASRYSGYLSTAIAVRLVLEFKLVTAPNDGTVLLESVVVPNRLYMEETGK
jgi:hypothetical protein